MYGTSFDEESFEVEANYLQLHYHQVKEVSKKFNQQKQNLFS
jgi:hypothetical protein